MKTKTTYKKSEHPIVRYKNLEEWEKEGVRRFGDKRRNWKFKCPLCGFVASGQDWVDAGDKDHVLIAYSCIGRLRQQARGCFDKGPGPCDYAGGGLFPLNPVQIGDSVHRLFEFADCA